MSTLERSRCRLCANLNRKLQIADDKLISQIRLLLQIHIDQNIDDGLPKNVCSRCTTTVITMSKFHNKVQNAQKRLASSCGNKEKKISKEKESPGLSNEFLQISHVQKLENPDPDPEPDSYAESEYADNNEDNMMLKFEINECSEIINDCPSEPVDDEDNQFFPIYEDSVEIKEHDMEHGFHVPCPCTLQDRQNVSEDPLHESQDTFVDSTEKSQASDVTVGSRIGLIGKHKLKSKDPKINSVKKTLATSVDSLRKTQSGELIASLIKKHKIKSKVAKNTLAKVPQDTVVNSIEGTVQKPDSSALIARLIKKHKLKSDLPEDAVIVQSVKVPLNCSKYYWPEYPWKCNNCGEMCSDVNNYKNHQCFALHKRFHCADCARFFSRPRMLYAHIKEDHWERYLAHLQLECDICHTWFSNAEEQEIHRDLQHPEAGPRPPPPEKPPKTDYKCEVCGKLYKTRMVLKCHMKLHSGVKPYSCKLCGKSYINNCQLQLHIKVHMGIMKFICDQCGKGCLTKRILELHLATHSDERRFICKECGKGFKTEPHLRLHETIHTGINPHVCSVCGLRFRRKGQLTAHSTYHTGEKPHTCEFCDKTFRLKINRDVHQRQHTGEQPFTCPDCKRTFTNWANCSKHIKRIHKRRLQQKDCKTADLIKNLQ